MYLAAHLGQPSPFTMLRNMTAYEFRLWRLYFLKTRFGPVREDGQRAIIASALISPHLKKGRKVDAEQFLIPSDWPADERPAQSWRSMLQVARQITAKAGGEDLTKSDG